MNALRMTRRATTVAFVLSAFSAVSPVHAWDATRVNQPGSFEAIMSVKLPGVYGPRLPMPAATPRVNWPAPGSAEGLMMIKTPGLYGPRPAGAASRSICLNAYVDPPGSFRAIMSVKDPAHDGRTCR